LFHTALSLSLILLRLCLDLDESELSQDPLQIDDNTILPLNTITKESTISSIEEDEAVQPFDNFDAIKCDGTGTNNLTIHEQFELGAQVLPPNTITIEDQVTTIHQTLFQNSYMGGVTKSTTILKVEEDIKEESACYDELPSLEPSVSRPQLLGHTVVNGEEDDEVKHSIEARV